MTRFKEPDRSTPVRWRGSLDGLLAEDHLARFIWHFLCGLDFGDLEASYPSVRTGQGRPPYHPRLLAALWIYGLMVGIETATGIALGCQMPDDLKWLAGGLAPCDQTLLNFLTRAIGVLPTLWAQLLVAMQEVGLIDLSLVAEDGTKVRVNASPRSFRTLDKIEAVIGDLSAHLGTRLAQIAEGPVQAMDRRTATAIAGMRSRLARAERAKEVVETRRQRRGSVGSSPSEDDSPAPEGSDGAAARLSSQKLPRFDRSHFRQHPDGEGLLCPGDRKLKFIGEYSYEDARSGYRLYGLRDCTDCPLKGRCTDGRGRRVKVPLATDDDAASVQKSMGRTDGADGRNHPKTDDDEPDPTASLTEPDSNWMLATSRKRWEPAFNADIAVTRDGIIVSQFLSTENNDYHFFEPALRFILNTLGRPESWVGDGHYSTVHNIVLASAEGIVLYAPRPGTKAPDATKEGDGEPQPATARKTLRDPKKRQDAKYRPEDFDPQPDGATLTCPAGEELRFVGEYPTDNLCGTYRLYRRRDCSDCQLKPCCTASRGRSVKVVNQDARARPPSLSSSSEDLVPNDTDATAVADLLRAHDDRMANGGKEIVKFRGHTSEPANAHLHQHGLGRFHVRGLDRCGAVLTLACMGHNMRKWALKMATERVLLAS